VAFVNGGAEPELWGRTFILEAGVDRRAVAEFVDTAHACAAVAEGVGAKALAVIGEGLLAQLIRRVVRVDVCAESDVVVDTTGLPSRILSAVRALPRLGCLVLAAPPRIGDMELGTYADVHVRGLSIVGVPWTSGSTRSAEARDCVDAVLASMASTSPDRPSRRAPLYMLHSRGLA
jgi:hypothetical protein